MQWKNPKNKQWTKFDTDKGKITGTSPNKFKGVPLSESQKRRDKAMAESQKESSSQEDQNDSSPTFF